MLIIFGGIKFYKEIQMWCLVNEQNLCYLCPSGGDLALYLRGTTGLHLFADGNVDIFYKCKMDLEVLIIQNLKLHL